MLSEKPSRFWGSLSREAGGKVKIYKVYKLYWKWKEYHLSTTDLLLTSATSKSIIYYVGSISVETNPNGWKLFERKKHEVPKPLKQMAYISAISCSTPRLAISCSTSGFKDSQMSKARAFRALEMDGKINKGLLVSSVKHGTPWLKIYCFFRDKEVKQKTWEFQELHENKCW